MDSCFSRMCKFGSFKILFAAITSLPELYFRFRRFILLLQTKKVVSINYSSITNSWKPLKWMRLDVTFTLRDIYINSNLNTLTKFTSSRRSTEFKEVFLWSISQMTTKTVLISTRIVISYVMKRNIPFWVWKKEIGNRDSSLIRIS